MRVLIAEDNFQLLGAYERRLRGHFDVVPVASSGAAIDALISDPSIEAVVSDYDLGDGTGADILAWVRTNRPELPFLLATGNTGVDLDVPTFTKPFDPENLIAALRA